jgi:hypothetical protein
MNESQAGIVSCWAIQAPAGGREQGFTLKCWDPEVPTTVKQTKENKQTKKTNKQNKQTKQTSITTQAQTHNQHNQHTTCYSFGTERQTADSRQYYSITASQQTADSRAADSRAAEQHHSITA